ncbi:MAG: glycosyltransferase family A protein [bacterium]|nr:glycosyltransferase family A protein [bacterium]
MIELSVVIPTRNRAIYLKDAIESIFKQTLNEDLFEVLIIDNGSTDETARVVRELSAKTKRIKYFFAPEPGLHVGRHLGAKEAKGEILVYADDDILATPDWLNSVKKRFEDSDVALLGGKILPMWEGEIPSWIDLFKSEPQYGWTIGFLSLLDFGDESKLIPADYVYGCNFSIRKSVLYECGGFHPDGMPQELIRYRGDGESALSRNIMTKGYAAVYEPLAAVYHRVPPQRLTVEYFCQRAFNQGVSESFTEIRACGGLSKPVPEPEQVNSPSFIEYLKKILNRTCNRSGDDIHLKYNNLKEQFAEAYKKGKDYHRLEVERDPALLKYVLKDNYY